MATFTPNLNLRKPGVEDTVNVTTDLNQNFDKIDTAVGNDVTNLATHIADVNGSHGYPAPADLALANHTHSGVELDSHTHTGEYDPAGTTAAHSADTTNVHGIANTALLSLAGHVHDITHNHSGVYEPLGAADAAVASAINDLVGAAPATLNTLSELADALGDDPNAITTLTTAIGGKADANHVHNAYATHTHTGVYEPAGTVATHEADTTNVHGIANTALLLTAVTHALIDHDDIPGAGQVPVQASAPTSPDLHDLWVDSDEPALSGGGGGASIAYQPDAPASPAEGDLWADSDEATPPSTTSAVSVGGHRPDIPPASASVYDYEFEGSGSSLPTGWSWVNQSTATYLEQLGIGVLDLPAGASDESRHIVRGINTAASWTLTAKLQGFSIGATGTLPSWHVLLRDSATGKEMRFSIITDASAVVDYYTNTTTFSARRGAAVLLLPGQILGAVQYVKIVKNSATSWDWYVSIDGAGWMPMHTGINVSTDLTPDQFGVGANMRARRTMVDVSWFRVA